jgi:hypothetical protein
LSEIEILLYEISNESKISADLMLFRARAAEIILHQTYSDINLFIDDVDNTLKSFDATKNWTPDFIDAVRSIRHAIGKLR